MLSALMRFIPNLDFRFKKSLLESCMNLEAYALIPNPQKLVPAPPERAWMDAFKDGHAYRCLPLTIGNAYGWQLLLPVPVIAAWNGGTKLKTWW